MKKLFIIAGLLLSSSFAVSAQKVDEAVMKVGKEQHAGFVAQANHGKKDIKHVLEQKLAAAGLTKSSGKNGYRVFRGVVWSDVSTNKVDMYYKIKGNKKKAKVYMLVSKGYDNFVSSANDAGIAGNITSVLQSLDQAAATHKQISAKQGQLQQLEKQNEQSNRQAEKLRNDIQELQTK
jgi:hypothetical protein